MSNFTNHEKTQFHKDNRSGRSGGGTGGVRSGRHIGKTAERRRQTAPSLLSLRTATEAYFHSCIIFAYNNAGRAGGDNLGRSNRIW